MKKTSFFILLICLSARICFAFGESEAEFSENVKSDKIMPYDFLYMKVLSVSGNTITYKEIQKGFDENEGNAPEEGRIAWRGDVNDDTKDDYIVFSYESTHDGYYANALISNNDDTHSNIELYQAWNVVPYKQDEIIILCMPSGPYQIGTILVASCKCLKFDAGFFLVQSKDVRSEEFSVENSCPKNFD